MRKYAFRKWDIVRARSVLLGYTRDGETVILPTDEESIVGRVIGFGPSAGHDWYKVASGGDVYNCRDDELELIRRGHGERDVPPMNENELERFLLIWRPMSVDPPKGELCAAVWKSPKDEDRVSVLRWDGVEWIMRDINGYECTFHRETFRAWALWEWPEIDPKPDGEEGVSDDADSHHR